jgi:hypothetical protein
LEVAIMPTGTMENPPVAKKKVGRPKSKTPLRTGRQVRLDPDLVAKADVAARRKGMDVGPFLSELIEPIVNREYVAVLKELAKLEGGEG